MKYTCNFNNKFWIFLLLIFLSGCLDSTFSLGDWRLSNEKHKYVFLSIADQEQYEKDLNELKLKLKGREFDPPEISPLRLADLHEAGHKSIGKSPKFIVTGEDGASVTVSNYGYVFLQVSKELADNYDDIEWAWKMSIENNSKYEIHADLEYGLLDENGFILTTSKGFSNLKTINPNTKETFQSQETWRVKSNSTPHPIERVVKGDYGISLKYMITVIRKGDL
ncbi:hypothetical protein PITCH_A300012 [uncultured Desulfobacterium sp.]|uniref:Lipoprotein n=1 Tax=uncultured Desulfobacterium sp. TaxID=201089 RepID=A0A445MZ49_9BACT|nr:hypothetical protein PITCH_A300012 [uncultured Desulfobacterium sp.]